MKILIENALLVTLDEGKVYRQGCVAIEDSYITYAGEQKSWEEPFDKVIDARGGIVMPGLINAHSHSPMTVLRGCADDLSLETWLHNYIFPLEDKLDPRAIKAASLLACAEMIASGTTTFADMYFMSAHTAEAVLESGVNANLARCVTGQGKDYKERLAEARSLYADFNGAGDGQIRVEHSAHAVYTCGRETLRAVAEAAKQDETGIQIHLSETMTENRDCYRKTGKSPTEVMRDYGIFECRTIAAHCVYLSGNDMDILKRYGVSIVHNPTSNLKLASGVANIKEVMEKEINVALGTDGAASNNALDLFSEVKLAALLHKGMRLDPTLISAEEALAMATVNGARALGCENERGKLCAGYRADIILLDPDAPALIPVYNPVSAAVYNGCGGQVLTTIINGKVVMENREILTVDIEAIRSEMNLAAKRMGISY